MKKLVTITGTILIALLFNVSTSFAFPAISATANSEKELSQAIHQLVKFPSQGVDQGKSGYVLTSFKVNNQGQIEVKEIKGTRLYKTYVQEQMEKISVENSDLFGKNFQIKIYFDFQEKFN
ncbi:MAG: hypothetical protein C0599_09240 [Salinivirgaceae bacterium]|nr:MAG: hypothetical protein C0599_09240 [Salinivirgaceae bacterium]